MDKYEFNIKVEQIKKLVGKSDYDTAVKIADTIDWRRVRNTNLLSMVAMVYEKNEDYQEAKAILLQAFERAPISKRLLYKLAELAVKEGSIEEAEAYYREFGDLASDDPRQQLLRYMILKAKGAPAQQLIHSLESYTSVELDEKWLYELAELYSLAGMSGRCVETCDRIMLMFGLGKYVDKAMELKIKYAPLTSYQMDLVENRDKYEAKLRAVEQEFGAGTRQTEEPEQEDDYEDEQAYGQEPMADEPSYTSGPAVNRPMYGRGPAAGQPLYGYNPEMDRPIYDESQEMFQPAYDSTQEMGGSMYDQNPELSQPSYDHTMEMNGPAYDDGQEESYPLYGGAPETSGSTYDDDQEEPYPSYDGAPETSGPTYDDDQEISQPLYDDREMPHPLLYDDDREISQPLYDDDQETSHPLYGDPMKMSQPTYNESLEISQSACVHNPEEDEAIYDHDQETDQPMYLRDPELGQDMMSVEDSLRATMQDAAAQESLAREISKISYEKSALREEPRIEHTRVLEDIRRVGRSVTVISGAQGSYVPEQGGALTDLSGPLIEEDESELEASSLSCYENEETEYEDYEREYPVPDYVYRQSAASAEYSAAFRQQPEAQFDQPDMLSHELKENEEPSYAPVNADTYREEFSQNHRQPELNEESSEFEDLYEEAEDETEAMPVRNHLMIEARTPEQGLQMAVETLKQIHKESGTKNPVAKITGSKLSKRGILASAEKLAGKDLVIEEAGDLTREALEELNELMEQDTSGMIVVLIDNSRQMEMLHGENPELASKFECIGSGEKSPVSLNKTPASSYTPSYPSYEASASAYETSASMHKVSAPAYEAPAPINKIPSSAYREEALMEHGESRRAQEHHPERNIWQDEEYGAEDYQAAYSQADDSYGEDDFYEEDTEDRPSIRDEEGPGFHGEEMDIDEFAQYACRYANEIDCNITGKSMLALYERIEIMEEDGIPLNRTNAESLIEEAADRAEKPSFGKRIKGIFSTKYDKDGLLILKEEHFIY